MKERQGDESGLDRAGYLAAAPFSGGYVFGVCTRGLSFTTTHDEC